MSDKNHKNVSDEFARLALLEHIFANQKNQCDYKVVCGVAEMDDAALIELSPDDCLVITSDFVRGSGFYLFALGYLDYFDVGYYLMIANISDIAAMGARPCGALNVVRYAESVTDAHFAELLKGIRSAADAYGVAIVGGDIGGHTADVFAATVFGFMKTSHALFRSTAQVGDYICLTGTIGKPITALLYFKSAKPLGFVLNADEEEELLASWKRPRARVAEGVLLSSKQLASACQDVSDGLKATILQMASASNKGFKIFEDRLPISESTKKLAAFQNTTPAQIAMSASVDFELLFTVSPANMRECSATFAEAGLECVQIGEVTAETVNVLVRSDGRIEPLPGIPWKQQMGDGYLKAIGRGERE